MLAMKGAHFFGVSWVVDVECSATLFLSISTQRQSGSSATEREVSYYINKGRDSARAEKSARLSCGERDTERPSTRQDGVEGHA